MKNKVKELISENILHGLEGPIEESIKFLNGLNADHPDHSLSLNVDYDYDDNTVLSLYGVRDENDKERQERLEKQAKNRKKNRKAALDKAEKEKKLLAKLKAKYE